MPQIAPSKIWQQQYPPMEEMNYIIKRIFNWIQRCYSGLDGCWWRKLYKQQGAVISKTQAPENYPANNNNSYPT